MEFNAVDLAEEIIKYRKLAGLSQKQLADKAKVSQSHVSLIEKGEIKSITVETLDKLAAGLGISLDVLLSPFLEALSHITMPSEKHEALLNEVMALELEDLTSFYELAAKYYKSKNR